LEKIAPLKRGENSLSEIFVLSSKDLKELQVSERFRASSMRIDEKRWCQASVLKGGRSFCPPSLPRRKDRENR
jgi:hypothetical protein